MHVLSIASLVEAREAVETGRGRELRELARLSQVEVAGAVGVAPPTVNRWENRRCLPRGRNAARYAEVLRDIETVLRHRGGDNSGSSPQVT